MFAMLSRIPLSRPSLNALPLERSNEPLTRRGRLDFQPELRRLSDTRQAPQAGIRVVLPVEERAGAATATVGGAPATTMDNGTAIEASAIAAMVAQLGDASRVTDASLAGSVQHALSTLASVYRSETYGAVYEAIKHWMTVASGILRPSVPTGASTSTPAGSTTTPGASSGHSGNSLAGTSVPYEQLPARMQGGISSGNGMPVIIVRDASELASLPMWAGMHPAAAQNYHDRLADALRNESGSVMGFAGYEIEVVGTNGVERSSTPATPAKPWVTNAEIAAFVKANLDSPSRIASAMREYGVSFNRIEEATGYTRKEIVDYVMASSCQELIALL